MDGDYAMSDRERNTIVLERVISRDPEIHSGDLVFAGTRVPVDSLANYLKEGYSIDGFLDDFPSVQRWQVESYLDLASEGLDYLRAQNESASR